MPDLTETEIDSISVFEGKLLKVRSDTVRLPDGKSATREYIEHPGAVVIIPFLDNQKILFERQHRYPLRTDFFELPAGKIDRGEEPLSCAQRELLEETGYAAQSWRYLCTIHPCIGYSDEKLIYFLARELSFTQSCRDEEEFIEIFELSLAEALQWVREGKITDVKTVVGLFWAEKLFRREWD